MVRGCAIPFVVLLALLGDSGHGLAADGPGGQRIRFHSLTIEHGLPQATARMMVQDHDGFVWIGTQDGLARYDGHEFEVFRHRPGAAEGLGDNHIIALAVAGDGALWVGTQAGGLSRRDRRSGAFTTFRAGGESDGTGLASDQVTALLATGNSVLAASSAGKVQRWVDGQFENLDLGIEGDLGDTRKLRRTSQGDLLIAARGGAWRCAGDADCGRSFKDQAGQPLNAYDMLEDGNGGLWIASESGAFRFDAGGLLREHLSQRSEPTRRLGNSATRALLRDAAGRLWIGTLDGLSMVNGESGEITTWRHQPGRLGTLAASRVQSLIEDRDGLIWVGTWTNGLSLLDPRTEAFVSLYPDPNDPLAIPGAAVPGLWADPDGSLWLGILGGGGLVQVVPGRGVVRRYLHVAEDPASLSHNFVQFITRDRAGTLWVATQGGGLNRLRADGTGFDHFRHDPEDAASISSDFLLHLHADSDNTLWIATLGGGLNRLCDSCSHFEHSRHREDDPLSLGGDTVNSTFEDSQGRLWVALRPGGIALMDRAEGTFSRILAQPGEVERLSSNTITLIVEDRHKRLWFGTQGGGLYRMLEYAGQDSRFRRYSRNEGLGADAIGGVLEDQRGNLWVSTTTGISRLDPDTGSIENFGGREGAQTSGYFIGSYGALPDGQFAFGGLRGVTLFHPDKVPPARPPANVVLSRITSIGAHARYPDPLGLADVARAQQRITLDYPANDLTIEFSALAFAAPDSVHYRYRLDGLDSDWVETSARRRFAAYTNLPAGDYRFRLHARSAGIDGPETILDIAVGASPWQHPLAWALYLLMACGVLATFALQLRGRWNERARAQAALRESEERLKLALWGTGDELWDIDLASGELRRANPLAHIAASRDTYVAKAASLRKVMHPEDVPSFDEAFDRHLRGESESFEISYRVRDIDGEWCWLRLRGRIVQRDEDGKPLRVAGTVGDINALKRSELELQALNQALEQRVAERTADLTLANEKLTRSVADLRLAQRHLVESEKMAALGGLVAGVAHEINTPIGIGVTAASHLQSETRRVTRRLETGELTRSELEAFGRLAADSVEMILRNLNRADKLVRSFKQVAVDQGSEQHREIDLAHYLDEILTSLRPAIKRTSIQVDLECPPNLILNTLPGALYQIVVNLVMNSLIHGYDPGQEGRIGIEASRSGQELVIIYTDDGRGMGEEARRRIFEPFFTTRRGQGGSGLGMHIVYNLVTQALHGSIECDSAPQRGVYFCIRLPIQD
jgi:PAS domain S-box-containing protein